ncbi:MAG TPA: HD domain-containing protein [Bacillota bacterium]|nr:HD domain-containing protein [Bacillota bacterium]HOA14960.1 HD domain-containing protein [Bacillota bacterium]HOG53328.1 HD domain-containing protein [Bacillota bacterium]
MPKKEMKQFVNSLAEGDSATGVFQVIDARVVKNYLDLRLGDKTGSIPMKVWEWRDNDDEMGFLAVKGEKVMLNGVKVEIFDGRVMQFAAARLSDIKRNKSITLAMPGSYDEDDFVASSDRDSTDLLEQLEQLVESVRNDRFKALLRRFFGKGSAELKQFSVWPAAVGQHHAYKGGLMEHTVNVARLCSFLATNYKHIDRDLLITGALIHDIGKMRSYDSSGNGTKPEVSLDGVFMDHIAIGCSMVEAAIGELESDKGIFGTGQWDPMEKRLLIHMVLAHHGELEWGSPVKPIIMEAQLLHFADNTDAWANRFERAIEYANDGERGTMKKPDNFDRYIYIPLKK